MDKPGMVSFQDLYGDIEADGAHASRRDANRRIGQDHELRYSTALRNGFMRKVFGILAAQLILTSLIAAPFFLSDTLRTYIHSHKWPLYLGVALSFAILIPLACMRGLERRYPINYILLFAFTAVEGYLVGATSSAFDVQAVLLAFCLTAGVTVGLSLFALQTRFDITLWGGALYSTVWILLLSGLITVFIPGLKVLQAVYAGAGALLFSVYLVYDVQLIAGGSRQLEIGLDDYVIAALTVYLDVLNIFQFILYLVDGPCNQ